MVALLLILGVYLAILIGVLWISVHPLRIPVFFSPGSLGFPQEEVVFDSSDGKRLRGWWMGNEDSKRVAVLCHGYLMNRCELAPVAIDLHRQGYSCLLFDFRQHGKSSSGRCGMGWYERADVSAACALARSKVTGCRIVLIGSSMGAVASAFALSEDPALADAAVFDSAYSKLPSAVLGWWNFLGGKLLKTVLSPTILLSGFVAGFNPFKVDVGSAMAKIHIPKLIVHGECDNLANPEQAKRNFAMAADPKEIVWFPGRDHSEFRWEDWATYSAALNKWLSSVHSLNA